VLHPAIRPRAQRRLRFASPWSRSRTSRRRSPTGGARRRLRAHAAARKVHVRLRTEQPKSGFVVSACRITFVLESAERMGQAVDDDVCSPVLFELRPSNAGVAARARALEALPELRANRVEGARSDDAVRKVEAVARIRTKQLSRNCVVGERRLVLVVEVT